MEEFDASEFTDQKYSVGEVDDIMATLLELRNIKKDLNDKLKEANKSISDVEEKLATALEDNFKKNWSYGGYKASIKIEKYPKMSKDPEEVKKVAEYFKNKGGEDMVWSYFSVNAQTLRSFVKSTLEENPEEKFPEGIDTGFERKTIAVRKDS